MINKDANLDTEFLVVSLSNYYAALTPKEFLSASKDELKVPGLYSWWVDTEGASELTGGLGSPINPGMIYAGLAGATRWPSGKKSSNTLWMRIATMHLGNNRELSTFRKTIGAVLANARGGNSVAESDITLWMQSHLRVIAVPSLDADSLGKVEKAVLERLDPPFNLKGMQSTEVRRTLKSLRRNLG